MTCGQTIMLSRRLEGHTQCQTTRDVTLTAYQGCLFPWGLQPGLLILRRDLATTSSLFSRPQQMTSGSRTVTPYTLASGVRPLLLFGAP